MTTLSDQIVELVKTNPGLTDREITNALNGLSARQQPINQTCHNLEKNGILIRKNRFDGKIGNYLVSDQIKFVPDEFSKPNGNEPSDHFSEDMVKSFIEKWLVQQGWKVQVKWGHDQGIDIDAYQENKRWIIEVKGGGSLQPMRVNYFISVIGETLQRMNDSNALYSIAFPDIHQFRNLWEKLPILAKKRTGISILFVDKNGSVSHIY